MSSMRVRPVQDIPRLRAGADLARLLLASATLADLVDGDVLCVSSKAVAKVEGRAWAAEREVVVEAETDRVVARRGELRVVRTRHGLVLAAAGVDASNTDPGTVVALPVDPDGSARSLRTAILTQVGSNVGVVITDTAGRAWRQGQVDIAVGCAGLAPLVDLAGTTDGYGRTLAVTAPAIADELAAAVELVIGKAALTPAAVVSGLSHRVLPPGEHGPGAAALVRPESEDMFGLGAADAVHAAARRGPDDRRGFAEHPIDVPALVAAASTPGNDDLSVRVGLDGTVLARGDAHLAGAFGERLRALGWAHGVAVVPGDRPGWAWRLRPLP